MLFNTTGFLMLIALLSVIFMFGSLLRNSKKTLIIKEFIILFLLLIIHSFGLILQILYSQTTVPPIYFDYITYISAVFIPVIFTYIGKTYSDNTVNIKKYLWLTIIPIISLLVLWTNDLHNLFYVKYSVNLDQSIQRFIFLYTYNIFVFVVIILVHSTNRGIYKKIRFSIIANRINNIWSFGTSYPKYSRNDESNINDNICNTSNVYN